MIQPIHLNSQNLFAKMAQNVPDYSNLEVYNGDPNRMAEILMAFTTTYSCFSDEETELREVACFRVIWKAMVLVIQKQDLFVGRTKQPPIGLTPQSDEGCLGYYFHPKAFETLQSDSRLTENNKKKLNEIAEFWQIHNTVYKTKLAYTETMKEALPSDDYSGESGIVFTLWRMSGVQMDYGKLIALGIPGLRDEIETCKTNVSPQSKAFTLYSAMEMALDTLVDICLYYADQANGLMENTIDIVGKNDLVEMETILRRLPVFKPTTFREGLQLMFLYTVIDGARNYGRIDDAMGDIYAADLGKGFLSEEEAVRLLTSIWQLIAFRGYHYDSRMILGGKGRINEENADKLAMAIMETSHRVKDIVPQLALRFYKGQQPALYNKALEMIGDGNTFPMLYNDEVNIPAAQKAYGIPYEEAVHIIQFGCGEYVLNHRSVGTPSAVINLLQALIVTLHKGIDPVGNRPMGMPSHRYDKYNGFETFDQLWEAYKEQVEYHVDQLAIHEEMEYVNAGKDAPFLYSSMLMDDCIARGKAIYSGGIRYLGGTLESYGNSNVADSLMAIKQLVYEKKSLSFERMLEALNADFVGFEKERNMMCDCPKYGNDDDKTDGLLQQVHNHVCNYTRNQRNKTGLHSYLIVIINNDANTVIGANTTASPDGRKAYSFMCPGNAPAGGADKNGATAFLNSMLKPDTAIHAGAVQNMKFSKDMFTRYRPKMEALLATYFDMGGAQGMLTVVERGELEYAMIHPELYPNLLVRVGGFSERFVSLPRHTQLEILSRTLH